MKRVISILCVAVLLVSMLSLVGCGLSGNYRLVQVVEDGEVQELSDSMATATFIIKDNMATLYYDGNTNGPYFIDKKQKVIMIDGDSCPYRTEGKRLILINDEREFTFEKM